MSKELFHQRTAVIATMHHKEKVIAPLLQENLGINVIVPENFNTDVFGTFTREIQRADTQIITAKLKAEAALEITGKTIAIASEGSFIPHPSFPYIYANREIVIFLDQKHELEIVGEVFSTETNFNHQIINNLSAAEEFAENVGFPEHGLVIWFKKSNFDDIEIIKGITTQEKLQESVEFALHHSLEGNFHIETDMRALYNPMRMKNIKKATENLLEKITSCCPKCHTPGFSVTDIIRGLPCEVCNQPTELTMAIVYKCQKCNFQDTKFYPEGLEFANPGLCSYCNP
ncbi:MAG: hypothetical protein F6K62_16140 [Sphaerospermopsis sp. SIO1G2]|nr:hypothetical protein [Sphaerospermopsis sp. SIO1G2]